MRGRALPRTRVGAAQLSFALMPVLVSNDDPYEVGGCFLLHSPVLLRAETLLLGIGVAASLVILDELHEANGRAFLHRQPGC